MRIQGQRAHRDGKTVVDFKIERVIDCDIELDNGQWIEIRHSGGKVDVSVRINQKE